MTEIFLMETLAAFVEEHTKSIILEVETEPGADRKERPAEVHKYGLPKKLAVGKAAVASPADASGEHAVYYYAIYRDGKKETEIDPVNFICLINGVDYLAEVRKALGK